MPEHTDYTGRNHPVNAEATPINPVNHALVASEVKIKVEVSDCNAFFMIMPYGSYV
jgi:hypothetical protein